VLLDLDYLNKTYDLNIFGIAHVGAHTGSEIPIYIRNFSDVPMYLFEPQNEIFSELVENVTKYKNVQCFNFGLGAENKIVTFYKNTNNDSQSSSVLKPKEHLKYHPHVKFEKSKDIHIKTLDSLENISVNFLNLDVQGYELEVLKGSINTLKKIDFILTEVNRKELYEKCVLINELDKFLDNQGFLRCETKWWNNTGTWGDAFYIKKTKLNFFNINLIKFKNRIKLIKGFFFIKKYFVSKY